MKINLLVFLFCAFILVQEVSAQTRWFFVDQTSLWKIYVDPKIRRSADGNIIVKSKYDFGGENVVYTTEINCVEKESRSLGEIQYDSYGNVTKKKAEEGDWQSIRPTTGTDTVASYVCRSIANEDSSPNSVQKRSSTKKAKVKAKPKKKNR